MSRSNTSIMTFLALLSLVGCTSLAPKYKQPDLPVASTYSEQPDPPLSPTAASDLDWREFFTDTRLVQLIDRALQHNRDLRIAALNVERVSAQYQIRKAELFPTLSGTASASLQRLPSDLSASGQATESHQYGVNVGLVAYELDFFGRIHNLKEQALETYFASVEARRVSQISLVAEVANAFLAYAADQERLQLAEETLTSQKESLVLAQRRFEMGIASMLDMTQAQTSVESARVEVARFKGQILQDRNAIQLLVGHTLDPELLPTEAIDEMRSIQEIPAGLPSDLLQQRPDIIQAEHLMLAANANIGAARAAFFPSISLTARAGTASSSLSGLFDSGSGAWAFLPQINLPIFTWGRNQANLKVADVDFEIATAQYEKAIQVAFREVADALSVEQTIQERIDAQKDLTASVMESHRLSTARFDHGVDNYLSVLDAQRSLYAARQGMISIKLASLSNRVRLYKALGGGWQP